jgi:2-oxoglutarate dehydrogenase E1 component
MSSNESFANSQSASYIDTMYSAWLEDPKSVHISWQAYFQNVSRGVKPAFSPPPTLLTSDTDIQLEPPALDGVSSSQVLDTMKVQLMVRAYQVRGHQLAKLDPLEINFGGNQPPPPELDPKHYGFTESDLDRKFYLGSGILPRFIENGEKKQLTLREIKELLQKTYCNRFLYRWFYGN